MINRNISPMDRVTEFFDVDVLLPRPKGILITVKCSWDTTFADVKDKVWQKITNMMDLGQKDKFSFEGINESAVLDRYQDDSMTLRDSKLFCYLLKLVETRVIDVDKKFIASLSMLAGRNVGMEAAKLSSSAEVDEYHELMEEVSINFSKMRTSYHYKALLQHKYPPLVSPSIDGVVAQHERTYNTMQYTVFIDSAFRMMSNPTEKWEKLDCFIVPFRASVSTFISVLVEVEKLNQNPNYLLKICGREEYFFDSNLILPNYQYIQSCIRNNTIPLLVLTTYNELLRDLPTPISNTVAPSSAEPALKTLHSNIDTFSMSPLHVLGDNKVVSDLKEKFSVSVKCLSDLNRDLQYLICVYVALYSGSNRLEQLKTTEKPMTSVIEWNETLTFSVDVADLPRNAKLCFTIQKRRKTDRTKSNKQEKLKIEDTKKSSTSLYWVNLTVYDFKGCLRRGKVERNVWSEKRYESGFNPGGTCFPYSLTDTPVFTVYLKERKAPVRFYTLVEAKDMAIRDQGQDSLCAAENRQPDQGEGQQLEAMLKHAYGTHEMTDEDNALIWKYRVYCKSHYPHSLPKLIMSRPFDTLAESIQLYTLLLDWKEISLVTALQLLHMDITDPHVREFAVYTLDAELNDEYVELYCLQLVECVKHDLYLDSALTRFLLRRALNNHVLGHYLYWHLKSQVDNQHFGYQFALYIEFYLRCCGLHLDELNAMSNAMSKISGLFKRVKKLNGTREISDEVKQTLNAPSINKIFSGFLCMTDPRLRSRDIIVEKTSVFDSSMRPMKLTFSNHDMTCREEFSLMYKEGDDLRKDQLVSQFIQLINKIWLKENIDMKLIEYRIICTKHKAGVIEFIKSSRPLSGLIKNYRTYSGFVQWLKEKNPHPIDFDEARYNFIQSCCGYTLIHYVLGIADRHPSNILLTEDGKLVHIDFGHIMGSKKQKFGINREPAPFIFMKEWVDFISNDNQEEFKKFEQQFAKAYLILRHHTEEFLTLLHLMITAGMNEINTAQHLQYFTGAMCVGKSEDEAERHILKLLHESIRSTPAQQMHWFAHIIKH